MNRNENGGLKINEQRLSSRIVPSKKSVTPGAAMKQMVGDGLLTTYMTKQTDCLNKENVDRINPSSQGCGQQRSYTNERKLGKIQSIFVKENFEKLSVEGTIARWQGLLSMLDIATTRSMGEFAQMDKLQLELVLNLINSFTNYNDIKDKILYHCMLETWSFLLAFYAINEIPSPGPAPSSWSCLEIALKYIIQNIFYVCLIVIKASRSKLIVTDCTPFEAFVGQLQKFNFPTGVPLIKTLKVNNEVVAFNLRRLFS